MNRRQPAWKTIRVLEGLSSSRHKAGVSCTQPVPREERGPCRMPRWPWPGLGRRPDLCTCPPPSSRSRVWTLHGCRTQRPDAGMCFSGSGGARGTHSLTGSFASFFARSSAKLLLGKTDRQSAGRFAGSAVFRLAFDGTDFVSSGRHVSALRCVPTQ